MALTIAAMAQDIDYFVERVRVAAAAGETLRLRGGGSKDFYGESLTGAVLDTREFTGVSSYEPSELVVTVRAGTPLRRLEALLAESGQCLPFEPPNFNGTATVGGMVAAGLAGPARANVGGVRDYVLGLTLLNGRAELLSFGGQVMKNVAGYDLSRLMVGAMGTLGMLTEISLKVLPVAPAEATLRFDWEQAQALDQCQRWGGQPLPLNASVWQQHNGRGQLHVRLRGAQAAVQAACQSMGGERVAPELAQPLWLSLQHQHSAWFAPRADLNLWRLSLPPTAPALPIVADQLIEWHGGQRWLWAASGQGEALRQAAVAAGGHASLFRAAADQSLLDTPRSTALAPAMARIQRALKAEFDPQAVFNRGRLSLDF